MADSGGSAQTSLGSPETKYFFDLTPERILDAVEARGVRCTGRALALNSMENRVYEVEVDVDDESLPRSASERCRIAKFYRPGRWSREQILEEHRFLRDLAEYEIPVVPPIANADGETLFRLPDVEILFALFPKLGGRSPDELDEEQLLQLGRLIGRMHNVGAIHEAPHRLVLSPTNMLLPSLEAIEAAGFVPADLRSQYRRLVQQIHAIVSPWFDGVAQQRIHGDCHLRNVLHGRDGLFLVDFDDMVQGPCVQDLWLLIPGRDSESRLQLELLLEGYEQMRPFDRTTLSLIEPLRAMRLVYFAAWIGKRWNDPAFPQAFPEFGSPRYWEEQIRVLAEQLELVEAPLA